MAAVTTLPRKQQIHAVAQNLFRQNGYAGTSMRDIAKAVGIEAASLYSHIQSKEAILQEICFRIAGEFFREIEAAKLSGKPFPEQLQQAIGAHIRVIKNNLDAAVAFIHEWRFLTSPALEDFKLQRKQYEEIFKNILEQGIAAGDFRPVDLKIALPTIFSAMNWTYDWKKPEEEFDADKIAGEIFQMIFLGLKK